MTNINNNFVTQKALKLATALYMVTDIMSEKEPLKWHLRERAVALLEATDKDIMRVIDETLAILAIARIARAVSPMNAEVLEGEYRSLGMALASAGAAPAETNVLFSSDFFAVEAARETLGVPAVASAAVETPVAATTSPAPLAVAQPKIEVTPVEAHETTPPEVRETPESIVPIKPVPSTYMKETEASEFVTSRESKVKDERNKRRDAIIRLMYEKSEVNVKDIAAHLKDVSDKTIQRELIAMMEEGIIAREGDRRWAVYHLA